MGGTGNEGDIIVRDETAETRIKLDGGQGTVVVRNAEGKQVIKLGGDGDELVVKDSAEHELFKFNSHDAASYVGGTGNEGDVIVRDGAGQQRIKLDGGQGTLVVKDAEGKQVIKLGGDGDEIVVKDSAEHELFRFNSHDAALYVGGTGNEGDIIVRDETARRASNSTADKARLWSRTRRGTRLSSSAGTAMNLW